MEPAKPRGGRWWRLAACTPAILIAGLQLGCGQLKREASQTASEPSEQPGLFTVPADQQAHLKIAPVRRASWSVSVHTTGTVDWDLDRTTQAITQVTGPITRILVDVGTPVQKGQPLLYVSSPDIVNAIATYRKTRNREQLS